MTDIDAIIEGLSEAQKAAMRTAQPCGTDYCVGRYSRVPSSMLKSYEIATIGIPLNGKGQAVRARLLGDK